MKAFKHWKKTIALTSIALVGFSFVNNGNQGKYFEITKNLEIFNNLYKELNTFYVDDIDPARIMRIGVNAMMDELDPYTNYISESDIEGYRQMTEGKYSGIGATITDVNKQNTVIEIFQNTPAQKAGMKIGDIIVGVDGQSAKGKSPDNIYDILKGYPGTEVTLAIQRPGEPKELTLKVVRDEVEISNVPYYTMVSNDVGYVSLTTYTREAGDHVRKAFKELKEKNPKMKGFILDLRDNGGGLLAEAVDLCNIFIDRGEVVCSTKGKVNDWDRTFKTTGNADDLNMPVAVLINKMSASASEITCGTIQDLDRGVLIGQRSYGKGLVQNTRDIGYNAKLKLTTAKYYIPSGRCIQAVSYSNGKPVDIPDSLRTAFKTRNGRTVLDGGGVLPDILIEEDIKSPFVKSLVDKYVIFDYVTQFATKNPTIPSVSEFSFKDFDNFVQFVNSKNFNGETESDKALKELKEKAKKENYLGLIQTDLTALENKMTNEKKVELQKHKAQIIRLIEKEIAARYYFEKGKTEMGLKNDAYVQEALKLFGDMSRYNAILKKK